MFNQIDDKSVRRACHFIKFKEFPDGKVLFRQLDKADHFYGILKGEVAVKVIFNEEQLKKFKEKRKKKKKMFFLSKIAEAVQEIQGVEVIRFKAGNCFGQWGLLENKERTGSAICCGETYLFELNREGFEESFKACLRVSERKKKAFLASTISILSSVPEHSLDLVYRQTVPIVRL